VEGCSGAESCALVVGFGRDVDIVEILLVIFSSSHIECTEAESNFDPIPSSILSPFPRCIS
jgi:hypothetical protein